MPTRSAPGMVTADQAEAVVRAIKDFYSSSMTPTVLDDGEVLPSLYDGTDLPYAVTRTDGRVEVVWESGPSDWAHEVMDGGPTEEMRVLLGDEGMTAAARPPAVFGGGVHVEPATSYSLSVSADPTVPDPPKTVLAGPTLGAWKLTRETVPAGTTLAVWKFCYGSSTDRYWATPAGLLVQGSRNGGRQWTWKRAVTREEIVLHVAKREALGYVLIGKPTTIDLPTDLTRLPSNHPDRTSKPATGGIPAPFRSLLRKMLDEAVSKTY